MTGQKDDKSKTKNKDDIICKKCPTCHIIKTPRVFHCNICDCCISVHDHHCPWIGACIGQRNHKFFFGYVFVTWVLSIFALVLNCIIINNSKGIEFSFSNSNFKSLYFAPLLFIIVLGILTILLTSLVVYHIKLIS